MSPFQTFHSEECQSCTTLRNEVARVTVQLEVEKLKVAEIEQERDEVRTQRDTAERRRKTLLEEWRQETEIWLVTVAERDDAVARVAELEREIEVLRRYGNKDCTDMADAALSSPPPHDGEPRCPECRGIGIVPVISRYGDRLAGSSRPCSRCSPPPHDGEGGP